jgi:hypothetical protein
MRIANATVVVVMFILTSACSQKHSVEPIVVHVFRDPAVTEVDSALRAATKDGLSTPDQEPIVIATYEFKSYSDGLGTLGSQVHPELVILNSPEDVRRANLSPESQSLIRVATNQYYLIVPSWTSAKKREAAEVVVAHLHNELLKGSNKTSTP